MNMDASSPLAAMHPAPPPTWGQHTDMYRGHSHLSAGNAFGAGTLNIREQMQRSRADYFNLKTVRGSSPTASLAADLSQNFRIDNEASPFFPTPRRALFTSNPNVGGSMDHRAYVTTPPLPASSSPAAGGDMMDISPLPQKKGAPATSIEVTSPSLPASPDIDDDESMVMEDSPIAMSRQQSLEPAKPLVTDRRKLALRRPSLGRAKGYSANAVVGVNGRLHAENQVSSFKFGSDSRFGAPAMSPSECFAESPPRERRPTTANSSSPSSSGPGSFRPKPQFSSLTGTREVRNGSPINGHSRQRPRRQCRRSLSMFENPGDVVRAKADEPLPQSGLQSVMDVEDLQDPTLPHFFPEGQNDSIPRIARSTFLDVLDGRYNDNFDQKVVVDCRFEYEYDGGHIDGAVNYNDKELLARQLFESPMEGRVLMIFHCEYSAHRAPMMARHVRAEDRTYNAESYPRLTYPEVYILDGGYSEFFTQNRDRCYPQSYVGMNAEEHATTCEREMGKLQQKRKGLSRARTFAFGARESMIDASPTGRTIQEPQDSSPMMMGDSPSLGADRTCARRMASY